MSSKESLEKKKAYQKKWFKEHIHQKDFYERKRAYLKKWFEEHPWKHKEYDDRKYQKNRDEIIRRVVAHKNIKIQEYRLRILKAKGEKCELCGLKVEEASPEVFELHHINPEDSTKGREWLKESFDLNKVLLVCANCHRMIHKNSVLAKDLPEEFA